MCELWHATCPCFLPGPGQARTAIATACRNDFQKCGVCPLASLIEVWTPYINPENDANNTIDREGTKQPLRQPVAMISKSAEFCPLAPLIEVWTPHIKPENDANNTIDREDTKQQEPEPEPEESESESESEGKGGRGRGERGRGM